MTSDCVMELLSLQVGSNKVSAVIQSVCKNLFDVEIQPKYPPSRKTVERIVAEGRLLSLCQSAEVLLENPNSTLHMDGTSRDHRKVIDREISTPHQQITLGCCKGGF